MASRPLRSPSAHASRSASRIAFQQGGSAPSHAGTDASGCVLTTGAAIAVWATDATTEGVGEAAISPRPALPPHDEAKDTRAHANPAAPAARRFALISRMGL